MNEDTSYSYDAVGNLVSQTSTGAYELALEYAYDLAGRMTSESRSENGATLTSSYIYDALGQLVNFTRSDGQSESYAYDAVGNMLTKTQNGVKTTMSYNAANQLISSVKGGETTTYSYDANGNLVKSENAAGARSYAYNALNLLEKFTREDGYSESYTYNANRLLSSVETSDNLTTTLTWDILYGDGVVIQSAQNGEKTSFVYGLERISAISGSTRTEYVHDGRGSVAAELIYNGNELAEVTSKSYSPFGEQLGEVTSGFGYNGEYYNVATGMVYLRARFYAPEMNRFSQKDLLRGSIFDGISLNRYLYCQNDPVNFADYDGLEAIVITGGVYGEDKIGTASGMDFVNSSNRELRLLKEQLGDSEEITWVVTRAGYTADDEKMFEELAEDIGVRLIIINSANELTNYLNNKDGWVSSFDSSNLITSYAPQVSLRRESDPITYISVFSHGTIHWETNRAGTINLGYNSGVEDESAFYVNESTVKSWNQGAFDSRALIKIFACNIATSMEESLACSVAKQTGATVFAYYGKSSFANIMGTRTFGQKALDWVAGFFNKPPVSKAGRDSDAAYAKKAEYKNYIPWEGALYPPISAGKTDNMYWRPKRTDSYAVMALPSGFIAPVSGREIPDLVLYPRQQRKQADAPAAVAGTLAAANRLTTSKGQSGMPSNRSAASMVTKCVVYA